MDKISYSFPIYAPVQKIILPEVVTNCFAIRISNLHFHFDQLDKHVFMLSIINHDKYQFVDGVDKLKYTFIHFNDGGKNSINYTNNFTFHSEFSRRDINSLDINIKIDKQFDGMINLYNPVYMEIDFFI